MEWLVGLAAGLLVLAGGLTGLTALATSGHRLQLDARLQQELRGAADLMARELRRSGTWAEALRATQPEATTAATPAVNPFDLIVATPAGSSGSGQILYSVSRDTPTVQTMGSEGAEGSPAWGFRVSAGTLQMQLGAGAWQPLTDPGLVRITQLRVSSQDSSVRLEGACARRCCDAADGHACAPNVPTPPGCPRLSIRLHTLLLIGQATQDTRVQRAVREQVRVRNDRPMGVCPTTP